jgi:putative ABC transport system permease protein
MIKNYFKIAIAVLKRRKFFTFISLFGISFTLTILIVIAAFINNIANEDYPDRKRDRSLYMGMIQQRNDAKGFQNTSPPSFYFLNNYVSTLKSPEKVAISSMFTPTNTYVNNKKLVIDVKYTNDAFWDVLEFDYLEGKPYNKEQIAAAEKVAVISERTRDEYFGEGVEAVGKYIETDNQQYRISGVVKDIPITMLYTYGEVYLPYTVSKKDYNEKRYTDNYSAIILAKDKSDFDKIREELSASVGRISYKGEEFDKMYVNADSYFASYTRIMFSDGNNSGLRTFIISVILFAVLFMLLPTLNLVNINTSRIMERSSEIGVRKAFGATSGTLVLQFIVENVILTLIGGLIGFLLSWAVLAYINYSGLIPNIDLSLDLRVLMVGILCCFVFGFFSGVFPAWRMSRLHVVTALKAN